MLLPLFHLVVLINLPLVYCQIERENCNQRRTCKYNEDSALPECQCDPTCLEFKDCCKEYIFYNNETSKSDSTDLLYSCVNIMMEAGKKDVKLGSFMIDRCSKSKLVCNVTPGNLESLVPVSNENITFRNSFCAKCNGVNKFTHWRVSYEIRKFVEVNSLDLQSLLHENASINLKTDILPKEIYNLYPPNGVSPRYCPSNIFNGEGKLQDDNEKYQNFVLCKDKVYKNLKQCERSGFCESDECKCTSYDSSYLTALGDLISGKVTGTAPKSLQILVQLGPKLPETEGFTEGQAGEHEEFSFTFIRKRIHLYFELNLVKQQTLDSSVPLIEECLAVLMVFLESSTYGLVTEFNTGSIRTNNGIKYIFAMVFRSMAKLSKIDLETLFNLHMYLKYQDVTGKIVVISYVRTVPIDFKLTKHNIITTIQVSTKSKVTLVQNRTTDFCTNLVFHRQTPKESIDVVYDVRCLDKDIVNNVGGGFGRNCYLPVLLSFLSLICALWIPIKQHFKNGSG